MLTVMRVPLRYSVTPFGSVLEPSNLMGMFGGGGSPRALCGVGGWCRCWKSLLHRGLGRQVLLASSAS